jgi:hypothetical protein
VISPIASRILIVVALFLLAEIANAGSREKPAPRQDPLAEWLAAPPFATLELSRNMISIPFPSMGVPAQSARLDFVVIGNARATLTAEPSEILSIDGRTLGKAMHGEEAIGYDLILEFPKLRHRKKRRPHQSAPEGPTSAHMIDMVEGGMEHAGTIHLVTDPKWAANGGLPLPGTYVGEIVLTLTADY